jgi:hypothetical protein
MEMLIEKGAYIKKTDRLLELGIPEHLRRRNAENEMRAVNKVHARVRARLLVRTGGQPSALLIRACVSCV